MTIEAAIFELVSGKAAVAALVGTRVYPGKAPQGVTRPYVVYSQISLSPVQSLDGWNELENGRWQFDCWDDLSTTAKTLARAVMAALKVTRVHADDQEVTALLLDSRDLHEPDTRLFRVSVDFSIWNRQR